MKRNIDLTIKRDFSLAENNRNQYVDSAFLRTKPKVPWSTVYKELIPINREEDLCHISLFPIGFVYQIKQYKEYSHYADSTQCDRCGCKLKFSIFSERLCKPCSEQLYKEFKGFSKWNERFEMIPMDFIAQYLNIRGSKP